MLLKQESITSQELGSQVFCKIANSILKKGKSTMPPLFEGPECCLLLLMKQCYLLKNFSKNSNLDGSGISFPFFPCRVNLNCIIFP